jgi:hypothetical protein
MQDRSDPGSKKDGFWFSPDRILRFGPLRLVYLLAFAVLFVLTELGRKVYRPYIYRNGIDSTPIAGLSSLILFFVIRRVVRDPPAEGL